MSCSICTHKPANIVYEDSVCYAFIPVDATVQGHIQIIPKQHYESLEEVPDDLMVQLYYVASYAASAAYERLGCQGTNIICNNGQEGSQQHLVIHILPRKENDGLNFQWTPKQLTPADFDDLVKKIKDKTDYIGVKKEVVVPKPSAPVEQSQPKPDTLEKGEENYMIKHLYRIP